MTSIVADTETAVHENIDSLEHEWVVLLCKRQDASRPDQITEFEQQSKELADRILAFFGLSPEITLDEMLHIYCYDIRLFVNNHGTLEWRKGVALRDNVFRFRMWRMSNLSLDIQAWGYMGCKSSLYSRHTTISQRLDTDFEIPTDRNELDQINHWLAQIEAK